MKKCDACCKTTLLPENLGSTIICKRCLLKINGLMWKYRKLKNGKSLESNKVKALELARKSNFPDKVILGINEYFEKLESNMSKCEVCGEMVLVPQKFGKTILCINCYELIDITELKNTKYFDIEELNKGREKVLKIAKDNNFPTKTFDYINERFDKKGGEGWLYTINGGTGQILRVYNDHLVITTSNSFDEVEMAAEYKKLINVKNGLTNAEFGIGSALLNEVLHLRNPLSVKSMVKITREIANNKIGNSLSGSNSINVRKGNRNVSYKECDYISLRAPEKNETKGFIVLRNSKAVENGAKDILFFFNNSTNVKKKIEIVAPIIEKNIARTQYEKYNSEITRNTLSVSEQLRELKSLLDDGIITEEEFEKKKKNLLDL